MDWGAQADNMLLMVAITGMPGAGKSTAAQALTPNWKRIVMGDVIREETRRRGLDPDARNTGEVMRELREKMGEAAVAKLCMKSIASMGAKRVVVDGIRSMAEVDEFRKTTKVLLVAVHASPGRRYELLKERGRGDDPLTQEMFQKRDHRELGVGIGTAIAMADEVVSNEHNTPAGLTKNIKEIANRWLTSVES